MKKAVIFDLDGVLVHTDKIHYAVWVELTNRLGIPFSPDVMDRVRGMSRMDSLDIVLSAGDRTWTREEKESLAAEKNRAYVARAGQMTPDDVDDDVWKTLEGLKAKGVLLAVGSSSKNAPLILERTGLGAKMDAVADGTMIQKAKPDPEVFLLAARLLGVTPEEALVVEDADAGILAAHCGGFTPAAFGGSAMSSPLAQYRLQTLSDLLTLV